MFTLRKFFSGGRSRRWLSATVAGLTLVGALAGCGGSISTAERFQPNRLVVFGDELSLLVTTGVGNSSHYGINAATSNGTAICTDSNRWVWVQYLASTYGRTFAGCNPNGVAASGLSASMQAQYGARVADVLSQIQTFKASSGLGSNDLVTVLVGMHDILQVYNDTAFSGMTAKQAEIYARGALVGQALNTIIGYGARVIVSTTLDVGLTPYAQARGASAMADLTALTNQFNLGMRQTMTNDGTKIGLIELDSSIRTFNSSGSYNHVDLACNTGYRNTDTYSSTGVLSTSGNLLSCTTNTLVTGSTDSSTTYLWADALHPNAYVVQKSLGGLAQTRATANF